MKKALKGLFYLSLFAILMGVLSFKETAQTPYIPVSQAIRQPLTIEVKTIGELEAARSLIISSSIKGDQGKIIALIEDGVTVQPGDVLVKLDPTPFEEKINKLRGTIKGHKGEILALEQAWEWEKSQADHKNKIAEYELESAKLELDKITHGEGPQEIFRLKSAMYKALLKWEELKGYSNDLQELERQGFLNIVEMKQAQKKVEEEKESYEMAKVQFENYEKHVYPMLIKKGEAALKKALIGQEEVMKLGHYQMSKAYGQLEQARQELQDHIRQLKEAKKELAQTEITAPSSGMVVHREDYRNGQKRKPRVGDVCVKNQPLIDLPDLSGMVVKTRIREIDLYKVDIGKKATIEIDAYPEFSFQGTLSSIGVLALGETGRPSEEKYFDVWIALEESNPRLRPGMTTRATIHVHHIQNALTIPVHAIFEENHQTFCYLSMPGGSYEKRKVVLGASNDQWAEVTMGLQENDVVCLLNPLSS